jgi:hypothetical protein
MSAVTVRTLPAVMDADLVSYREARSAAKAAEKTLEILGPLERSRDAKVSPVVRRQSSKWAATIPNSFGTSPGRVEDGGTCPGYSPTFCSDCYAIALERIRPAVRDLLGRNAARMAAARTVGIERLTDLLAGMLEAFRADCIKRGLPMAARVFRPYWSGDVLDALEARAWAAAWSRVDGIAGWQYTRTLDAVPILAEVERLTLYVSVDVDNVEAARPVLESHATVLAAACGPTFSDARGLLEGRSIECPENAGRMPLVVPAAGPYSSRVEVGEDGRGACTACRVCVDGRANVMFSASAR